MVLQAFLGAKKWKPWRRATCTHVSDTDEEHNERENEKLVPQQPPEAPRNGLDSANQDPVSRMGVEAPVRSLNDAVDGGVSPTSDIPRPPQFRNDEYGPYPTIIPGRGRRQSRTSLPVVPEWSTYGVYSPYDETLRTQPYPETPYPDGRRDPSAITNGFYPPNDGAVVTTVQNDRLHLASRLRGRRRTERNAQRPCELHRIYSRYGVPLDQEAGPSGSRPGRHNHPGARSNPNIPDTNVGPPRSSYRVDDPHGIPSPYEAHDKSNTHSPLVHPALRQVNPSPEQSSRSSSSSTLRRSNAVRYPVVVELHADELPPDVLEARRALHRDRLENTAVAETDGEGRPPVRGNTTSHVGDGSQETQERILVRITSHPLSNGPRAIIARVDTRPVEDEDRMSWEEVLDRAVQRSWESEAHGDDSSSLYPEDREWHDEMLSWDDEEELAMQQASGQPSGEAQGSRSSIPRVEIADQGQQMSWGDELKRAELELMKEIQTDRNDAELTSSEKVRDDSSSVYSQDLSGDQHQSLKKDEDDGSLYAQDLGPLERPGEPDPEHAQGQEPRKWKGKEKAVEPEEDEGQEQPLKRWKGKEKAVEPEEANYWSSHSFSVGDYRALIDQSPSLPVSAGRRGAFSLQGGQGPSSSRHEPAPPPLPKIISGFRASIASLDDLDTDGGELEWVRMYYKPGGAEQEENDNGEGNSGLRDSMFH